MEDVMREEVLDIVKEYYLQYHKKDDDYEEE